MVKLLLVGLLGLLATNLDAQTINIAPQPGGWTFRPGNGISMTFGSLPFPDVTPIPGMLIGQYQGQGHPNNPGSTLNWNTVTQLMVVVQSYNNSSGTSDERNQSFTFPFNVNQNSTFTMDLDDRWIKRIDIAVMNQSGWSALSNSSYSSPQHTGKRPAITASLEPAKYEWRVCIAQ